ncbi:DSBA-like thioredoxin domain-containing protein [Colletotrichum asianum]
MSPEAAKSDNSSSRDLQSAVLQTTLQEISSRPTEPERGASADDCCVICLDQITEGCEAQPCHHRNFDYLCLVTWLEQQAACPLCKTEIKEVRYDFSDDQKQWKTFKPAPAPAAAKTAGNAAAAQQERRYYSQMFASDSELVSRARTFLRRELQVFEFLSPDNDARTPEADPVRRRRANNAEFLLEYIVAILKTVDMQGSMGQAEELIQEFLGLCPFCYLGKARLNRAIDLYQKTYPAGKEDKFNVSWQAYYLDPTAPKKGVPVNERMAARFGADRLEMMHARMKKLGAAEGFNFTFDGKVGHTRDAHRAIQLAKTKGPEVENAVVTSIMKSYFEEGGDITSWDTIVDSAVRGGLAKEEVKKWLEEGKGGEEVDRQVEDAYRMGVRGVPHFVINDKYEIGGAQDVGEFLETLVAAREGGKGASGQDGLSC